LLEALISTDDVVLVSCRPDLISDIVSSYPDRIVILKPSISESKLETFFSVRLKRKSQKNLKSFLEKYQVNRLVILMSHPWDVSIHRVLGRRVKIYRVIHDLKTHPGDFWPSNLTIRRLLRSDVLIALSDYIYSQLPPKQKILSSLSRRTQDIVIQKPEELEAFTQNFVLILGRDKKYQSLKATLKLVEENSEAIIVTTIKSESSGLVSPKRININRWLSDHEVEYLIKNCRVLVCLYQEASQSGVVEQGKYWGVPILVSNKGALPEQVRGRPNCAVVDSLDREKFLSLFTDALSWNNVPINGGKSSTILESLINSL
jgi:hypothetical protein